MDNERKLSKEEYAIIHEALRLWGVQANTNPGGFAEYIVKTILSYAEQKREGERCKWTETGKESVIGLPFLQPRCKEGASIKVGEFCPFCGKRIEEVQP